MLASIKKMMFYAATLLLFPACTISADSYILTREQTAFFTQYPQFLAYLTEMQDGKSPEQIKLEYKLNNESQEFYLHHLQRLGILVPSAQGGFEFVWGNGAFNWKNGDKEFSRLVDTSIQRQISERIIENINEVEDPNGSICHNLFSGFRLTKSQSQALWNDLDAVRTKYHKISLNNRQDKNMEENLQRVIINVTVLENWKPPLLREVPNIKIGY